MDVPFETIVQQHGDVVLRVSRALVGPLDAEDAWSETFLAALRAWPELRPDSDVRAWLLTIAHNRCVDLFRARARTTPMAEPPERSIDPNPVTDWAAEPWISLRALPLRQREAITMHHIAGLPWARVAELLGTTTDAARRAGADGMSTLRNTVTEEALR